MDRVDRYEHADHQGYGYYSGAKAQDQQDDTGSLRRGNQVGIEGRRRYTQAFEPVNDATHVRPFQFGRHIEAISQHQPNEQEWEAPELFDLYDPLIIVLNYLLHDSSIVILASPRGQLYQSR